MFRKKILTLPFLMALGIALTLPISAQFLRQAVYADKIFRQSSKKSSFRNGAFGINIVDGFSSYLTGCIQPVYFTPSIACPQGATGWLTSGFLDGGTYYQMTSITGNVAIKGFQPQLVKIVAGPPSDLPRPLTGFVESGYSILWNISPDSTTIRQYDVVGYTYSRLYAGSSEGTKMKNEIMGGVYTMNYPSKNGPVNSVVALQTNLLLLPDAASRYKQFGFWFTAPTKFDASGFAILDANNVQTIKWTGLNTSNVAAGVDQLYFSIQRMTDPLNPNSQVLPGSAIFPGFVSGNTQRILLPSPVLTTEYTIPPQVTKGGPGVVQVELVRNVSISGVTYDQSSRAYQLPVKFVNAYTSYAKASFGNVTTNTGYYDDFDLDGFTNITEWALGTRAADVTSIPLFIRRQQPELEIIQLDGSIVIFPAYFGTPLAKNLGLDPTVTYTIERSIDNGLTWAPYIPIPGDGWDIYEDAQYLILYSVDAFGFPSTNIPAGSANHRFRYLITTP